MKKLTATTASFYSELIPNVQYALKYEGTLKLSQLIDRADRYVGGKDRPRFMTRKPVITPLLKKINRSHREITTAHNRVQQMENSVRAYVTKT